LAAFVASNVLTMLFYKAIGIDKIDVYSLFGLIATLMVSVFTLILATDYYKEGVPLPLRILVALSAPLILWGVYGLYLLTFIVPWEVVAHAAAIAAVAALATTLLAKCSYSAAVLAAAVLSAHLSVLTALAW